MLRKTAYQFVGTRSIHMRTHLFLLDAWHWGAFIAAHSYFRRWRGAWRKTARFVVQIFWKFSCAQLVSRRNIAQQFLACETVGFEAWFWAQRHSLLQDCPFSSKPWAWTGSFLQVAIKMLCLTRWGFIAAHNAKLRQMVFKQNTLTCCSLTSCFQNIQPYRPQVFITFVSHYHRQVCYITPPQRFQCVVLQPKTKQTSFCLNANKKALCMHAVAQASCSFQASNPKLH